MKFVILLVVLAIVAPFAAAQEFPGEYDPATNYGITSKCEAYSGTPETCQDFVDPNIWVPTNYTQAKIQQEISDYATIDTILAAVPSPSCKAQFAKLLCGTTFRRCQTNTLEFNATYSLNITVGLPVCKSVCVAAVDGCRPFFEAAGYAQYLPNCSYEVSGYPVWPEASLQLSVYGQNLTLNCYIPPGPDSLCLDAGLVTVCAGSALSSPFYYFSALLAELSVFEFLSALVPFYSLFDFRLF